MGGDREIAGALLVASLARKYKLQGPKETLY